MRISSLQVFHNGLQNMLSASSAVTKTQEQISLGKKLLTPSDDPVGATRALALRDENAQRDQYLKNIDVVESRLKQEDTLLGSVSNVLQRVRELSLQAANTAVVSQSDRIAIAQEMQQRVQEMLGLLNTRDTNNEYIFSGFKGDTQPFQQSAGATLNNNGTVFYRGDEGQRQVQVASSTFVAANDSGYSLFVDVPSATNSFTTRSSEINQSNPPASISAGFVYDQTLYDAFYPEDLIIQFQDPNAVGPAQANYNVIQKSDGRVLQSNVLYTSGTAIQINGAEFSISGTPVEGDAFLVESTDRLDMLTSLNQLIDGLVNLPTGTALQAVSDKSITNIDNALENILRVRADVGGRLNTLESTKSQHQDEAVASQKLLSSIEDLDYNEAISRLSFQSFVLEAAQQSYARVSRLSLFDKL